MPVKGSYLAIAGGGAVLLWSGIKGKKFTAVLRNVVSGQDPRTAAANAAISGMSYDASTGGGGGGGGSGGGGSGTVPIAASVSLMLVQLAKQFGWNAAQQLGDWHRILNAEASSPFSTNPETGAFGYAQALGHGTAGSAGCGRNEYGHYISDKQASRANCGHAPEQLLWMAYYIQDRYGSPSKAWLFHQQNGWY
jgi:hypothetical protein